ncbi:hypothetical protein [Streptomyces sp. CS62]|uniref:hypothetical protein n=1 Tax=Streptomyces sp. CS62 TaxID=3119268 RepID=UPI002F93DC42
MPVAFDTNSERSGASCAHSGSPTRGARKRFSQSGMDGAGGAGGAVLSVMPLCKPIGLAHRWAAARGDAAGREAEDSGGRTHASGETPAT